MLLSYHQQLYRIQMDNSDNSDGLDINKVGRGEYSFLELMLMTFLVQVLGLNLAYVLLRRTVILVGMLLTMDETSSIWFTGVEDLNSWLICGRNLNTLANPFCGKQVAPGEACTKTVAEKEASRVDFHSRGLLSYNYYYAS